MKYREFREQMLEIIAKIVGKEVKVSLHEVGKTNDVTRYGVSFRNGEHSIAPTIYLESFFQRFLEGEEQGVLAKEIVDVYERENYEIEFSVEDFQDYQKAKEHIFVKVVEVSRNRELLKDKPYKIVMNLAMLAYYSVDGQDGVRGSVGIGYSNLEAWNINEVQLLEEALENTERVKAWTLDSISDLLEEAVEDKKSMYVLSNKEKYLGAATICYYDCLEKCGERIGNDFYILPSSIHELILVPKDKAEGLSLLKLIVQDINDTQVPLEEVLSYDIYYYDLTSKKLSLV